MNIRKITFDDFIHFAVAAYAVYAIYKQINAGLYGDDISFWASMALIYCASSFFKSQTIKQYETYREFVKEETEKIVKNALKEFNDFKNKNKK